MKFTKMHGAGNDYIYVDCTQSVIDNPSQVAIDLSDRHFGIGSDGLILIKNSDKADVLESSYMTTDLQIKQQLLLIHLQV